MPCQQWDNIKASKARPHLYGKALSEENILYYSTLHDGIPDWWKIAYGFLITDPTVAMSDPNEDWISNLECYQYGANPFTLDLYYVLLNEGESVTSNTVITVDAAASPFPFLLASLYPNMYDPLILSNNLDVFTLSPVANTTSNYTFYFQFATASTNGLGKGFSETLTVDLEPPVLQLDPGSGQVVDPANPLLLVRYRDADELDLSTLVIQIDSVDVTTNFAVFMDGAIGNGSNLTAGNHTWSAQIADIAGNLATTSVTFTATSTLNTNAPTLSEVDLGDGVTVMPDVSTVWVQGVISDPGGSVYATVNGRDTFQMNKRGSVFGYLVPLDSGTNWVVLSGVDHTGTQVSTKVYRVERSRRYRAAITSPELGTFANGEAQWVSGYVSTNKDDGLPSEEPLDEVTVNGVATELDWAHVDANGNVPFTTVEPVPVPADGRPLALVVQIIWPTTNAPTLGMIEGYRVAKKEVHYRWSGPSDCGMGQPYFGWSDETPSWLEGLWAVYACFKEEWVEKFVLPVEAPGTNNWIIDNWRYAMQTNALPAPALSGTDSWAVAMMNCGWWNIPAGEHREMQESQPSRDWRMGSMTRWVETDYAKNPDCVGSWHLKRRNVEWAEDEGMLTVNWPLHYEQGAPVLLTFEGMDYTRLNGEAFNGWAVLYDGHAPDFVAGNNVSYWATVSGSNFTVGAGSFQWPTSTWSTNALLEPAACDDSHHRVVTLTGEGTAHHIEFSGFHNSPVKITKPAGSLFSPNNNISCWLPGPARFDFQGVATNCVGSYRLDIQGEADMPPGFNWTLTPSVGGLLNLTNKAPLHVAPTFAATTFVKDGDLTLDGQVTKQVRIYKDHLGRDMANFSGGPTDDSWSFTKFHVKVEMKPWNCFGSVQHAYNGGGSGNENAPAFADGDAWHKYKGLWPFKDETKTRIDQMKRGDVVRYYTQNGSLQHSATCCGAHGMTWGANNDKLIPATNGFWKFSWKWAGRSVLDVAEDYGSHFSAVLPAENPFGYIIIYTKPQEF